MLASFVIGFHTARINNLLQTLRFLTADHADVVADSYIELVCQDDCDTLPPAQLDKLEALREKFQRSCVSNLCLSHMWLPFLTNHGVNGAETDKVIVLESDRILPPGYFAKVIGQLREGVQITCRKMKKLTTHHPDEDIRADRLTFNEEVRTDNQIGMRNVWSGNTAIMKSDYFKAGGMDEDYIGYGWADNDMTARTEKAGIKTVFTDDVELHLWHPPATYGEGDQKQMFIDNGLRYCKTWGHPLPDWFRQEVAAHKKVMI